MTATGHAVIGTVIAAKIGNPALAIPIALASHVAADFFPHWDMATNRKKKTKQKIFLQTFFDVIIGFVLSFILLQVFFPTTNVLYGFFIVFISQSFDWIMAPYYFFNIKIFKWMYDFQKKFDHELNKPWGIINQVGILVLIVILAKIF